MADAVEGGSSPVGPLPEVPIVSLETMPVATVSLAGIGAEHQFDSVVAVGDDTILLAWADDRTTLGDWSSDILAQRYAADGTPLDADPIWVSASPDDDQSPVIAYGEGVFLVVWWTITQSPNGAGGDGVVRAARVALDGTLLDASPIELASNAGPPTATFAGDRFYIAFEPNAGGALRAMTLSPAGAVLSPPIDITEKGFWPALTRNGSHAMLAYAYEPDVDDRHQRTMLLDSALQPLAEQNHSTGLAMPPLAAGGDSGAIHAWESGNAFVMERSDTSGDLIDASPIQVEATILDIARDTDGYLILSGDGIRRLDDGSDVVSAPTPIGLTLDYEAHLAIAGNVRVATWSTLYDDDAEWALLDQTGASLDNSPRVAPHAGGAQVAPALGRVGGFPFIAYAERTRAAAALRFGLLAGDGSAPSTPFAELADASQPAVASGETATLLLWNRPDAGGVAAAQVTSDGSLGLVHELSTNGGSPAVTAVASGFFATYRAMVTGPTDGDEPYLTGVWLDAGGSDTGSVDIGWSDFAAPAGVGNDVVIAMRSDALYPAQGSLLCPVTDTRATYGTLAPGGDPAIAGNDQIALLAWTDHESRLIHVSVVTPSCEVSPPVVVGTADAQALGPRVYRDGDGFLLVWQRVDAQGSDLYASRVLADGSVLDPNGFEVSTSAGNEAAASFIDLGDAGVFAYTRFDRESDGLRVWTRGATAP